MEDAALRGCAVAVLGMGFRLPPDIETTDALWQLMLEGRRTAGPVPSERWEPFRTASPAIDGVLRQSVRSGSFLADIMGFDAQFFGISPREARVMDPQQRLALEVAWRALEHAGIPVRGLAGTGTGVFMGVADSEYGRQLLVNVPEVDALRVSGAFHYGVPNRISHVLDLHGPSMAVDTACSSSMSALHLAVQHLQSGQIPLALAGGTHLMIGPAPMLDLNEAGTLSPDGMSRPFAANGEGYGRGEGAAVVVLKRLADAQADGDRILAVIVGSAVHQDGWTLGMMAPSAPAQADMLRIAYARAGVDVRDVDYVEAHGTGTPVGDAAEATALAQVIGRTRADGDPCLIGSLKGNFGHLEAASGVAGLIKTVLCLRAGIIPATVGASEPLNPVLDWPASGLRVVTSSTSWPERGRPRRAGVSSFGAGGTIGHLVLEQAPDPGDEAAAASADERGRRARLFVCSGMSEQGMRAGAADLAAYLCGSGDPDLASVAHTLMVRRSPLAWRCAVVAAGSDQLTTRLGVIASGETGPGVAEGRVVTEKPADAVWIFSGQGSHWTGMGRELLTEEAFSRVLLAAGPIFAEELGIDARQALIDDPLEDVALIQALTFLMQAGLAALWRSHGVRPAAVIGHSLGEIAAAVTAGVLSLADGARLACRRARLMRAASGNGTMALVGLAGEEAARMLTGQPVTVAVYSSPASCVVSGDTSAVHAWCRRWEHQQLFVRQVATTVASHSAHMDPLLLGMAAAAAGLTVRPPVIPLYTTALDDPQADDARGPAYWQANLRNPVRFHQAITAAAVDGHRLFLEISPHPVVTHSVIETIAAHYRIDDFGVAHTQRRGTGSTEILANLATLHCRGLRIDTAAACWDGELTDLPGTRWLRKRFWTEPLVPHGGHDPGSSTLLGTPTPIAGAAGQCLWETRLDAEHRPFTYEHKVHGVDIVPAATLINTFLDAARQCGHDGGPHDITLHDITLHDITLRAPVPVAPPRRVQVVLRDGEVTLFSQAGSAEGSSGWLTHATARLTEAQRPALALPEPDGQCNTILEHDQLLELLKPLGVEGFGFGWRLSELRRGPHTVYARLHVPLPAGSPPGNWAPLLDAAMTMGTILLLDDPEHRMPSAIGAVSVEGDPCEDAVVRVRRDPRDGSMDVTVAGTSGAGQIAAVHRLVFSTLGTGSGQTPADPRQITHQVHWRPWTPVTPAVPAPPRRAIVVTQGSSPPAWLDRALSHAGVPVTAVTTPEGLPDCPGLADPATVVLVAPPLVAGRRDIASTAEGAAWLLFRAVRYLSRATGGSRPRLWVLTYRASAAGTPSGLAHAAIRGAGRAVAAEHPELWGGHIDLDTVRPDGAALACVLADTFGEDTYRVNGTAVRIARLAAPDLAAPRIATALTCRPDCTYLITGGLGGLGSETAHWLVTRGARRLILLNRTPLPPRPAWDDEHPPGIRTRIDTVRSLEARGASVHLAAADIADHDATDRALTALASQLPPVRGIVHTAGISINRLIAAYDPGTLHAVLAPKITGTLVLHDLFPPGSLDFLVLYSSIGQLIHSSGQGAYAVGNAFLDAFAQHRGGDTLTLAWPGWRDLGLYATATGVFAREMSRSGTGDVSADVAFQCWDHARRHDLRHAVVLPITGRPSTPLPLLSELSPPGNTGEDTGIASAASDTTPDWAALTPGERRDRITGIADEEVSRELQIPASDIDRRRPLIDMGLDSRMTLTIRVRLESRLRLRLPATLLWQHPTLNDLTAYLVSAVSAT